MEPVVNDDVTATVTDWRRILGNHRRMPNYLGEWIAFRKITQVALAHRAKTTRQQINKLIKRTSLKSDWLERLAAGLDCTPEALLGPPPASTTLPLSTVIDVGRLQACIASLQAVLAIHGKKLAPDQQAGIIALLYEYVSKNPETPPEEQQAWAENVIRLFR